MIIEMIKTKQGFQVPVINNHDGEDHLLIMAHGFGSDKCGSTPTFLMNALKEVGIGSIGFDFPGHGDSPYDGTHLTVKNCLRSYEAVEEYALKAAPKAKVTYFGSSFGGYMTILFLALCEHRSSRAFLRAAATDMPDLIWQFGKDYPDFEKDGYALMEGYNRPLIVTREFCEEMGQYQVLDHYQAGSNEIRMIHGACDSVASPVAAEKFAREKGAGMIMIPGAEHRLQEEGNPERVVRELIAFIKEEHYQG